MKLKHQDLTEAIIGAAIEVHRTVGPGLLESIYEECLCHELSLRGLMFQRQIALPLEYKGLNLENACRIDVMVENKVVVEIKAVETALPSTRRSFSPTSA
jgi:GxxExxY protein